MERKGPRSEPAATAPASAEPPRDGWGEAWLAACRTMPERCLTLLAHMEDDPATAVHGFRRAAKAWRSLLKLAPAHLRARAREVRRDVRALRRSLGASRDATVVATTLARLPSGRASTLLMESARIVASRADAARPAQGRREEMALHLRTLAAEAARWSLQVGSGRDDEVGDMAQPSTAGLRKPAHFLTAALEKTYRKGRRLARHDLRKVRIERLHALRTATIDLGYQLSFLKQAAPLTLSPWTRATEALRGELGRIVDLEMVQDNLDAIHVPRADRKALDKDIARAMRRHRRRAQVHAETLFAERPLRFRALVRGVVDASPPVAGRP